MGFFPENINFLSRESVRLSVCRQHRTHNLNSAEGVTVSHVLGAGLIVTARRVDTVQSDASCGWCRVVAESLREVTLRRGSHGFGFAIVGGFGSDHGDFPIVIKSVFPSGPAARDGRLKPGDQLLAVNGVVLDGATHEQAVTLLKNAGVTVSLLITSWVDGTVPSTTHYCVLFHSCAVHCVQIEALSFLIYYIRCHAIIVMSSLTCDSLYAALLFRSVGN